MDEGSLEASSLSFTLFWSSLVTQNIRGKMKELKTKKY